MTGDYGHVQCHIMSNALHTTGLTTKLILLYMQKKTLNASNVD